MFFVFFIYAVGAPREAQAALNLKLVNAKVTHLHCVVSPLQLAVIFISSLVCRRAMCFPRFSGAASSHATETGGVDILKHLWVLQTYSGTFALHFFFSIWAHKVISAYFDTEYLCRMIKNTQTITDCCLPVRPVASRMFLLVLILLIIFGDFILFGS